MYALFEMVKDIYEIKDCPDCGSSEIIYNEKKQHVICKDCNVIYEPLTPKEEEKYLGYSKSGTKEHESPKKIKESKPEVKTPKSSKTAKPKIEKTEPKVRRRRARDDD